MNESKGPSLDWSDALLLGYAPMDARHEEFVSVVSALEMANDADLPQRLAAVADHLRAHFEEENRWMTESDFSCAQLPYG